MLRRCTRRAQILRGDGKSNVYNASCIDAAEFPLGKATVVLMNPPFGDAIKVKAFEFLTRGMDGLKDVGRLVAVVPNSVLFGAVRMMIACLASAGFLVACRGMTVSFVCIAPPRCSRAEIG